MRTADFTTMCTKLPHYRLLKTVKAAWSRAVEYKANEMGGRAQDWMLIQDKEKTYNFETVGDGKKIDGIMMKKIY